MPRSYVKISDTVDFGIPRSDSSSCTASRWSLLIAASTCFNILRGSACCRPSRTWITFSRFSATFEVFMPHFLLCCTHCIIPESLLNDPDSFCGGMFKLNAKFDVDLLLHSLSHVECDGHTVRKLTQWHPPPPLTRTVKSSSFTHAHSSPLSLGVRLHRRHENRCH